MKVGHIIEGWGKALKLIGTSPEDRIRSTVRMAACGQCPHAKKSTILKFIHGTGHDLGALYCGVCKCPVNEKSLVANETCPEGKWNKL